MARKRTTTRRARARRRPFGAGIHRPRVHLGGRGTFRLGTRSPYKGHFHRVNEPDPGRRRNPMLAEYLLGNPRRRRRRPRARRRHNPIAEFMMAGNPRHRRRYGRRRHNPAAFGMQTFTQPIEFLTEAGMGLAGVYVPITVGNWLNSMVVANMPTLAQPGLMGSLMRAVSRVAVAWGADSFLVEPMNLAGGSKNAFRVGAAIGIGGSFIMDLLGRPLLIGPGDAALMPMYAFTGLAPAATAGAYFQRGVRGAGRYSGVTVPFPAMRDTGAYFHRGIRGSESVGAVTMFQPHASNRLYQ